MKKLTLSEKKQSCIDRINIKELEMQELLLDEKIEEQKKKNFLRELRAELRPVETLYQIDESSIKQDSGSDVEIKDLPVSLSNR